MKLKGLGLSIFIIGTTGFCATQHNHSEKVTPAKVLLNQGAIQTQKLAASHVQKSDPRPPLNAYGAVNVNANVPYHIQVPAINPSMKLPVIVSEAQKFPSLVPQQPKLDAKSYILFDATSNQILAASQSNKRLPPASITKLMLIYLLQKSLASGRVTLNQKITVPTVAWATGGSRMFLKPNEKVKLRDLISGMIVDSGNDAAVTVATYLAGTQRAFVSMMNHQAKQFDMTNTHFTDIMGLPAPAHYTSARDLAILGSHLVRDYPQYLSWFKQKWFTYNGIRQPNFNKLLFIYPFAIGLKTGSTKAAGYSLVSAAIKPKNQMRLVGVVLGTSSRTQSAIQSKALLEYGFRNFKTSELYAQGQKITTATVLKGSENTVDVGTKNVIDATYPMGSGKLLKAHVELQPQITAPVHKGQLLGTLVIKLKGKVLTTAPVVAIQSIKEGNFWQKLSDTVKGFFSA